ncbi:type IV secretion system DNA-binding domain-containing protein [Acidithiobacillus ferrianus]|nr:type IV secretion system DNA-binding domain-containing protein [Acidithiobacillus ferrianus]
MDAEHYAGPNDPRFARGSGFLEMFVFGVAAGGVLGYCLGWEAVGLLHGTGFLTPSTIWAAIRQAGLFPPAYHLPLAGGAAAGALLGGALGWKAGDVPAEIHVRGSRITARPKVMARAILDASPPAKGENEAIRIHPKIQTTEALETSHLLIVGGSGAGKTTILWPMIHQIVDRGDKAVIFSFKGDFEQKLDTQFALLAPWDTRSALWSLGNDIRTRLDAEALANTLIPSPEKEDNPMWTNGSRSLLVGIIAEVQKERGENWGFADLAKKCAEALAHFPILKEIISRENPMATSLISGGAESRTTASFLANVAAHLTQVINLGVAADNLKDSAGGRHWSVNKWINGNGKTPPVAILGFRPSAKALSEAWCASLVEQIVLKLEDLPDASPEDRRVWLILDEVPRMGKIPSITEALEVLRSKGVRMILGCQGIGQIEERYSKTTARSWSMQTATKIIGRIGEPEDQKWAANLVGERDLERFNTQYTTGSQSSSQGGSYQRVREHVVMPSQFGQIVKVTRRGPRAILAVAGSDHVGLLDWPFPLIPTIRQGREKKHEAQWVLPRYPRPDWGATPPIVDIPTTPHVPGEKKQEDELRKKPRVVISTERQPDGKQQQTGEAGETVVDDLVGDHLISQMLDQLVAPGAGVAFDILKEVSPAAPPVVGRPSQTILDASCQEREEEEAE